MAGLNLGGLRPGAATSGQRLPPQQAPEVKIPVENKTPVNQAEVIAHAPQSEDFRESPAEVDEVMYSVYPLDKFSIGSTWNFEKGVLAVTRAESLRIDEFLANSDHATRNLVKKIDRSVADAIVRNLRPVATKTIDSSTFSEGRHERTEIGTEDIAGSQDGASE